MLFTNKKIFTGVISLSFLLLLIIPILSFALGGLVPCDGTTIPCHLPELIQMINNIINWIISIAGVIFTIAFVYGGFLYMTSGSNPGNKAKAKSVITSSLTGFVIILCSWLIVYTIIHTIVDPNQEGFILRFLK